MKKIALLFALLTFLVGCENVADRKYISNNVTYAQHYLGNEAYHVFEVIITDDFGNQETVECGGYKAPSSDYKTFTCFDDRGGILYEKNGNFTYSIRKVELQ